MIPETLDQAVKQLIPYAADFKYLSEEKAITELHHSIGRQLRNKWSLWTDKSPLSKQFIELGINHADDMSSIILMSLHRILNRKPVKLKEQIEYYKEYWKRTSTCDSFSLNVNEESGLEWLGI